MSGSTFEIGEAGVQYEVRFKDSNANARVLVDHLHTASGRNIYGGTWVFSLEDDSTIDKDFNDVVAFLSWTTEVG